MSTVKTMTHDFKLISGSENYDNNPQCLFQPPYKAPDHLYNDKGTFTAEYNRDIDIEGFPYKPQVLIVHNFYAGGYPQLYVESSISKGLFDNNHAEWADNNLKKYIDWRIRVLKAMGLEVTEESELNARVDKFHYAKNFEFPDEETFNLFFELLKQIIFPWLKGKPLSYLNGGRGYRYHSDIWAILVYDKLAELSIEHPELVKKLREKGINYVIRIEIQFNDRKKLESYMKGLGFRGTNTLANMFQIKRLIAVFDKVLLTLHKKAPYFYVDQPTIGGIFQSIKENSEAERCKIFTDLVLQKERCVDTKTLISEIDTTGYKPFSKKQRCILTPNPYIPNIFLKLRNIVKNYTPIQHSEFDIQQFIYFEI